LAREIHETLFSKVDPTGRVVKGVGLQEIAYWDCRFETRRGMDICLL
jgi:hypothetical protein